MKALFFFLFYLQKVLIFGGDAQETLFPVSRGQLATEMVEGLGGH